MRTRILPKEEWHRLDALKLPPIWDYIPESDVSVIVVEDADRIVASTTVLRMTHLEGLWIDPAKRGNASLARQLLRETLTAARQWPGAWAFAGADSQHMRDILKRLGGVSVPMDLYAIGLKEGQCQQKL